MKLFKRRLIFLMNPWSSLFGVAVVYGADLICHLVPPPSVPPMLTLPLLPAAGPPLSIPPSLPGKPRAEGQLLLVARQNEGFSLPSLDPSMQLPGGLSPALSVCELPVPFLFGKSLCLSSLILQKCCRRGYMSRSPHSPLTDASESQVRFNSCLFMCSCVPAGPVGLFNGFFPNSCLHVGHHTLPHKRVIIFSVND